MEGKTLCNLCLDVLSGSCTEEERHLFERHLPNCKTCQAEMKELRFVWEAIPADLEWIKPPDSLKQQVMEATLATDAPLQRYETAPSRRKVSTKAYWFATVAGLLILLLASALWNMVLYRENMSRPLPIEQALNIPASEINQLMMLRSANQEGGGYGVACVVDNGKNKQFVVYLFGAKPTTGGQVYQVWLIENNERRSAGTMRVSGENGVGVLALPISKDTLKFDSIGITLEPDDRGSQPRGEKMFGSIY